MNRNNVIKQLINLQLILQLLFQGVSTSFAQEAKTSQKIKTGIKTASQILNGIQNTQQSFNPNQAIQLNLQSMRQPQPDKHFKLEELLKIPGLQQYLLENRIHPQKLQCSTLVTMNNTFNPQSCRTGIDLYNPQSSNEANFVAMLTTEYNQTINHYKNHLLTSNLNGQNFGIGCMNNAKDILQGFFNARLNELKKLKTDIDSFNEKFHDQTKPLLDDLKEVLTLLQGEENFDDISMDGFSDIMEKKLGSPSCLSVLTQNKLTQATQKSGFLGIKDFIKDESSKSIGQFSAETYLDSHFALRNEILSLANNASKNIRLNFKDLASGNLNNLTSEVQSDYGLQNIIKSDFFTNHKLELQETLNDMNEEKNELSRELSGIDAREVLDNLTNLNDKKFNDKVTRLEVKLKNKCLRETLSNVGFENILQRIIDPNISRKANRVGNKNIKKSIQQIIENDQLSFEQKKKKLLSLKGMKRYYLKLDRAYSYTDLNSGQKTVLASNVNSPVTYFQNLMTNCETQFHVNALKTSLSGKDVINKLKSLKNKYNTLAKDQEQKVKDIITKRMINCKTPEIANNTKRGSCSSQTFDTSNADFCLKSAFSCANKMKTCKTEVLNIVNELQNQKQSLINTYEGHVTAYINNLKASFDHLLKKNYFEGNQLQSLYNVGLSSPENTQEIIQDNFLSDFKNADTFLQDPSQYVENIKNDIKTLEESIKNQQNEIIEDLTQHIKETEKNYTSVIKNTNTYYEKCLSTYDTYYKEANENIKKQQQEYAKMMGERNDNISKLCMEFSTLASHPNASCSENFQDLARSVLQATGDYHSITKYIEMCSKNQESFDATTFCAANSTMPECNSYRECLKNPPETTTNESTTVAPQSCSHHETLVEMAYLRDQDTSSNITIPSFCHAPDNSGREVPSRPPPSLLEDFIQATQEVLNN